MHCTNHISLDVQNSHTEKKIGFQALLIHLVLGLFAVRQPAMIKLIKMMLLKRGRLPQMVVGCLSNATHIIEWPLYNNAFQLPLTSVTPEGSSAVHMKALYPVATPCSH